MSPTVADLVDVAWSLWPRSGAEAWDAVGLIAGDPADPVEHVHLAVDAVTGTVDEAIELGAGMLLVHHPMLLRGVTTVAEIGYKGVALARLIRARCALLAAHTNADVVASGTSAVIARRLGLLDSRPLVAAADADSAADSGAASTGLGRVGTLPEPRPLGRLAQQLAELLPATAQGIRVSGDFEQPVRTVALCAGAGDSLLGNPAVLASDVYITSDLRHHPASEFRETARLHGGPALIDTSHWASEWLWLETAAAELRDAVPGLRVTVSELRTDPWDFAVLQ